MNALIAKDAEVAPLTDRVDGLTAHPRLAEDGAHASETVVLPPLGPPSSKGTDALCPDFTTTREVPADMVNSVNDTFNETGALLEGA
jgi:hypothetical protein